jgi:hypothetical protein
LRVGLFRWCSWGIGTFVATKRVFRRCDKGGRAAKMMLCVHDISATA